MIRDDVDITFKLVGSRAQSEIDAPPDVIYKARLSCVRSFFRIDDATMADLKLVLEELGLRVGEK